MLLLNNVAAVGPLIETKKNYKYNKEQWFTPLKNILSFYMQHFPLQKKKSKKIKKIRKAQTHFTQKKNSFNLAFSTINK